MRRRSWFLGVILIFCSATMAWGNGVQESRLAKAKELIAQKNYNEAILLLTQIVKEEPDRLDQAQQLLDEIRHERNSFNSDFERLLKVLYTEQDEGKALEIIKQMEATDKNPNPEMQREIALAKRSAQLIYYQKRFNSIMQEGLADLDRQEYDRALGVYLTGYTIARDDFDGNNYGTILHDRVLSALADLQAAVAEFQRKSTIYKTLAAQGKASFSGNEALQSLPTLLAPLQELSNLRRRIYDDSAVFAQENDLLKHSLPELAGGDFFLSYAYLVSRGRPNATSSEGVVGTIDRLWQETLETWVKVVRSRVDELFAKATTDLDQKDWKTAQNDFMSVEELTKAGVSALTSWNWLAYPASTGEVSPEYLHQLGQWVPVATYLTSREILSEEGRIAAGFQFHESQIDPSKVNLVSTLLTLLSAVQNEKNRFGTFAASSLTTSQKMVSLIDAGWKLLDNPQFWSLWGHRWAGYRQQALELEASLVNRQGQLEFGALQRRFNQLETSTKEITVLVQGTTTASEGNSGGYRYPLQALQRLEKEQLEPPVLVQDLQGFIDRFDSQPAEVKTPAVAIWPVRGRDLLDQLKRMIDLRTEFLQTSRNNYDQSQGLMHEAQKLISNVRSQISNKDFQAARRVLNEASADYSHSLLLQENADLRVSSDTETKSLFSQILKGENELVIRDVRRLITEGSQAYLTGQFPQAEQSLLRAQSRWETTNTQSNPEIDYWLGLTRNALSINTGRVIASTDPLYNEIQQLLNFARVDYEKANERRSQGDTAAADHLLGEAQTTLGKVLLPFPLNQEARVLNLRIQQRRDPVVFPTLFRDDFNADVAKLGVKPQEAYNDLLDLRSIQPDYPGMNDALHQARLILGIDRRPPNPANLRESRNLTTLAQRTYDSNNVGQFALAIEQVNQALRLDPTNTAAQKLKDELSVFNPSAAFMTPTQLNDFNTIVNLFAGGRRLEAQSQLNQFLIRYPGLGSDPRVKELQRRLQAAS